jgi:Receptor family ligand binding region
MIRGLTSVFKNNPDLFRNTLRRGHVYYDHTRGIQCRHDHSTHWNHGLTILSHLRRIRFQGLTGPVAFDFVNGLRTKVHLDIMSMSFERNELESVSSLRFITSMRTEYFLSELEIHGLIIPPKNYPISLTDDEILATLKISNYRRHILPTGPIFIRSNLKLS